MIEFCIVNFELRKMIMKKNLRYYLLIATLMAVASVSAQVFAQEPQASMGSTSSMVGSGSTLPSAAAEGTTTTYSNGPIARGISRPAYAADEGDETPPDPKGPYEDPIGDGVMVMLALGAAYVLRKRKNL